MLTSQNKNICVTCASQQIIIVLTQQKPHISFILEGGQGQVEVRCMHFLVTCKDTSSNNIRKTNSQSCQVPSEFKKSSSISDSTERIPIMKTVLLKHKKFQFQAVIPFQFQFYIGKFFMSRMFSIYHPLCQKLFRNCEAI